MNFFIDKTPIIRTFYDELGLATEVPLAEGSSSSRDGGDQAILDFPGLDFGEPLIFGMDNVYAPFDGPSFTSYDLLLGEQSWNTDHLIDHGNSASIPAHVVQQTRLNQLFQGLPSPLSGPGAGDVAPGHVACQTVQGTERRFALDITNGPERVAEPLPPPLSSSSPSVSPTEVETPTNSSYAEESFDAFTASSSPAGKSAKQRKSVSSPTARKTRKDTPQSNTNRVKGSNGRTPRKDIPCIHRGCEEGPFYCETTMHRHVIDKHLDIHPECPGCGKTLSRPDALTRHLNTRPTRSRCRAAAKGNGWKEDLNGRLSFPGRTSRAELIAAVYGRTR